MTGTQVEVSVCYMIIIDVFANFGTHICVPDCKVVVNLTPMVGQHWY